MYFPIRQETTQVEHLHPNGIGCKAFPEILDLEEDINKTKEWTNSSSQNERVKFLRLFVAAQDMTTLSCVYYPGECDI